MCRTSTKICQTPGLVKIGQNMMALDKDKYRPVTYREGPEGEYGSNSTLSLTSALDKGAWLKPRPGRFTPANDPVLIIHEAVLASGRVWLGAEKIASCRSSIPGPYIPYKVAIPTELSLPT
jgi:hypothetical protein